ncbi:RDD family protein [Streptomyces sp. NPDC048448]|uniref:RDD family protein n=1 Tax=unclassified Streptomyces TaxID=2593676 RepID=UPI002E3060CD|nr:RDD family protein [Streptomyces sp. NBC_01455]
MSAPTPAPGDDRPREGYYPDPSIPGYVRYWNGAAWVPGTSRPAPSDGVPLAPPPGTRPVAPVPAPAPAPTEETGPHFFDEDPGPAAEPRRVTPAEAQHGSRPEPATAWGADRSRQSGFGGEQDRRVSWGAPQGADPRLSRAAEPAEAVRPPGGETPHTDGTATIEPTDQAAGSEPPAPDGTFVFRRRPATAGPGAATGPAATGPAGAADPGTAAASGAQFAGPGRQAAPGPSAATGTPGTQDPVPTEGTMTFRARSPRTEQQGGAREGSTAPAGGAPGAATPEDGPTGAGGGFGAGQAAAQAARAAAAQQPPAPAVPQQSTGPAATPLSSGTGGGQPSWAQQVHRLAGDEGPVAPWKPPVDDVFQAAARRHSAARPAALGRRLAARIVDTAVLATVTAVAAVPLGTKAIDHVNEKIDAAKRSGQTVTVWLLDGTTAGYLGVCLAVLLLFGVVYDALPTARWGRTLGKKLCGIEVRDIEGHEPPSFGPALRRWLVYSVPGVLVIGVVGVLWCLFDKPWRQCWHDKAAHTFVAARPPSA